MKTEIKTSAGKINLGKALAALKKENPTVEVPVAPTQEEKLQVENLNAAIEGAIQEKEEKKEKKTKETVSTDRAVNTQRQANQQGRQPQRVIAGKMPAFLAGFYFASTSARVRKNEAELAQVMQDAIANGKMTELLANDAWQYSQVPPTTMTGAAWSETAPETEFYITKGDVRQLVLDTLDENWANHFGKETVNPCAE